MNIKSLQQTNADKHSSTFLSVTEFGAFAHVGRTYVYELISKGELQTVKIGRRRLIPIEFATAWRKRILENQPVA